MDPKLFRRDYCGVQMSRDMTLFVEEDGTAYHIHAAEENAVLHISRLRDDYLEPSGEYVRIFPGRFHEAPSLFKRKGKYYMFSSDCTGWAPNAARVSVADSIMGPWTELGNPCRGSEESIRTTFDSQSTHVIPVEGREDLFIFMADRWRPDNAIDGRYVWLPVRFEKERPFLEWADQWTLAELGSLSQSLVSNSRAQVWVRSGTSGSGVLLCPPR